MFFQERKIIQLLFCKCRPDAQICLHFAKCFAYSMIKYFWVSLCTASLEIHDSHINAALFIFVHTFEKSYQCNWAVKNLVFWSRETFSHKCWTELTTCRICACISDRRACVHSQSYRSFKQFQKTCPFRFPAYYTMLQQHQLMDQSLWHFVISHKAPSDRCISE